MLVNISDLFDAFHEIAVIVAARFGVGADDDPSFSDLIDQLELDLFLPACARRATMLARRDIDPDQVGGMIRIRERDGTIRPGAAGRYHSHAFDQTDVPNSVLAANMLPRAREDVDLIIVLD